MPLWHVLKFPKTVGSPSARDIMGLLASGSTLSWSTICLMGLTVRSAVCEHGISRHALLIPKYFSMKLVRPENVSYLRVLRFSNGAWTRLVPPAAEDMSWLGSAKILPVVGGTLKSYNKEPFSVLTYNVLFDRPVRPNFEDPTFHAKERFEHAFQYLHETHATVICLQEVTARFLGMLMDQPWVRQSYYVADVGETIEPYGQLVLSRIPFYKCRSYQFGHKSHKRCLLADFVIDDHVLTVANSHLPAGKGGNDTPDDIRQRDGQLKRILWLLDHVSSHDQILCGDFNFGDDSHENAILDQTSLIDCWKVLRASEPGYTSDIHRNSLTRVMCPEEPPVRLDRILVRSAHLKPERISLVVNSGFETVETVKNDRGVIEQRKAIYFSSDHFGIHTSFTAL